jgi:ankyrin repeat protein
MIVYKISLFFSLIFFSSVLPSDIVDNILGKCSEQHGNGHGNTLLCTAKNGYGNTPLCTAIEMRNLEMVRTFLQHNRNLAYIANEKDGYTPFLLAANLGYVEIATVIARYCPDSAYALTKSDEMNALHEAIQWEERAFVDFILANPWLHRLINQGDSLGDLPLHYAAHTCNAQLLRSLLSNRYGQDHTAVNANNVNAADVVYSKTDLFETPKWVSLIIFLF